MANTLQKNKLGYKIANVEEKKNKVISLVIQLILGNLTYVLKYVYICM